MPEDPSYCIRPAAAADQATVEAIAEAAYSVYLDRMDKKPFPMLDDYGRHIRDGRIFVLEKASSVMGYVVIMDDGNGTLLLDNVAVSPDWKGKGYGSALISFAEDFGRAKGYPFITLYTNVVMTENQAIYRHLGYSDTGCVEEKGYRRIYYIKKL